MLEAEYKGRASREAEAPLLKAVAQMDEKASAQASRPMIHAYIPYIVITHTYIDASQMDEKAVRNIAGKAALAVATQLAEKQTEWVEDLAQKVCACVRACVRALGSREEVLCDEVSWCGARWGAWKS